MFLGWGFGEAAPKATTQDLQQAEDGSDGR